MSRPRRRHLRSSEPSIPMVPDLRNFLVERRLELGLTQADLADLAGVSRSSVQGLEAGRPTARLSALLAVAEALGASVVLMPTALATAVDGAAVLRSDASGTPTRVIGDGQA